MQFQISDAQVRAMARLEIEAGCDVSAGPDYGIHLGKVMELAFHQVNREKFVNLLSQEVGNVLSREEIEEVASNIQAQIQELVAEKVSSQQSA
jgi:protein-arginine kinase activator protein McsA